MPEDIENATQPEGVSEHTGFPNPATDTSMQSLDLNKLLVAHSASTYFFRVRGNSWEDIGVFDGDIAVVDRALDARKTDTVVWWDTSSEQFSFSVCSRLPDDATIWGVVTSTVHQYRKTKIHGE